MKKLIKSTVAVASAVAMAFTMAAVPTVSTLADDTAAPAPEEFDTTAMADGEVHYTVAGGFGKVTWNPLAKDVEMKAVEGLDGVYSFTAELPAYDEAAEWNNRFKVCRIDNTIIDPWTGSICLGTTVAADNQSQIRILNEEAGTFTVYFDSTTGAVVVRDANDADVDLSISWVGYDDETQFMSAAEVAASTLDQWPAAKVKVDAVPELDKINAALSDKLTYMDPSTMAEGENYYTVAGGFSNVAWKPLAKKNVMSATAYKGVYSYTTDLEAYDEATEGNNRFKFCRINNTIFDDGWSGSLCVGTTTYADNQSQIRILNKEAGTFTIYLDTATGAVVVKDADGNLVDLSISWVGYDEETQFMTPEEIAATTLDQWPEGKIKVDAVPNVAEINNALAEKLSKPAPVEASLKIKAGKTTLYTGKATYKTTIKATVKGDSKKVTYKSSNTKVATVSSKGVVTAKKAGKVVISAKANGITKKVTITVKNPTITVKSSVNVNAYKSVKVSVKTNPKNAGFKAECADKASKKIVKVTKSGNNVVIKGLKKGTAKVKITSGGAIKTVKVTVK